MVMVIARIRISVGARVRGIDLIHFTGRGRRGGSRG